MSQPPTPPTTNAGSSGGIPERLREFLLNPDSYPHRPRTVRLVQTHASFVFIAPPFVYKVKKAVDFGFLDFSTLERRRDCCRREVDLNRRLAPKVYLGVVPIVRRAGGYAFDGPGEVVEYAVRMRKLGDRGFLDRRLRRGAVVAADLDRVVARLRDFYQTQPPTAEIEEWGRIDHLRISTDENFRQTEEFIGRTLSRAAFDAIQTYTGGFYTRHADLFASRMAGGWIRDGHGDLRLEHVHLTPSSLQIYDCIEFNDRLRWVDVANDAAFLAMDLDFEGHPKWARYFAAGMASALDDDGLPRLIDFYKCYRAYVRGKVESLHSVAPAASDSEQAGSAERARRYFRLALRYAVAGSRPLVLAVMGRAGSGKSTLARALSAELGWEVCSSDRVRKQRAGVPLFERAGAAMRARMYTASMTEQTYERLFDMAEAAAEAGRGVILDATFGRMVHRQRLLQRLGKAGVACHWVEARADDGVVRQRLRARESTPDHVSDARLEDYDILAGSYEPPAELAAFQCLRIETTGPVEEAAGRILTALAVSQAEAPQAS